MKKKTKILFVQLVFQGGSYKSLCDIVKYINNDDYEIYLLVGRKYNLDDIILINAIKTYYHRLGQLSNHTYTKKLRLLLSLSNLFIRIPFDIYSVIKILKLENIDIVYINVSNLITVALASFFAKKKIIWHVREVIKDNLLGRFHIKIIEKLSSTIICNSKISAWGFTKATIIPNGIDFSKVNQIRTNKEIRKEIGINNEVVITIIGSITKNLAVNKGYYFFIDLCKEIINRGLNYQFSFWIIGDDNYKKPPKDEKTKLENYAKQLHIFNYCKFLGFKKNIYEIVNASDIIISPNLKPEGFGRTIIEAWSLGKPVVASKIPPNTNIIKDGFNSLLAEGNNKEDFADKICLLLNDKRLLTQICKNAFFTCFNNYNLAKINNSILSILSPYK